MTNDNVEVNLLLALINTMQSVSTMGNHIMTIHSDIAAIQQTLADIQDKLANLPAAAPIDLTATEAEIAAVADRVSAIEADLGPPA